MLCTSIFGLHSGFWSLQPDFQDEKLLLRFFFANYRRKNPVYYSPFYFIQSLNDNSSFRNEKKDRTHIGTILHSYVIHIYIWPSFRCLETTTGFSRRKTFALLFLRQFSNKNSLVFHFIFHSFLINENKDRTHHGPLELTDARFKDYDELALTSFFFLINISLSYYCMDL